ncbi:MAG: hypothetical protein COA50_05570 [Flavobacteriaceae bacterium]|nr:MAG: hypothetical protein COA50_05570 [Flavobacteriaceae bacterium]
MDLAEIQTIWSEMSVELEKQKKLTNEIILKMTQQEYRDNMNKIKYPEIFGGVICLAAVLLMLFHFRELDTWPLRICGIICLLILTILPIYSIKAIKQMDSVTILKSNYKQALTEFAKGKKQFLVAQKLSVYLGFLLLAAATVVFSKLMGGENILSMEKIKSVLVALPFGLLFFIVFTRLVTKHSKAKLNSLTQMLEKLEEES